MRVTEISVDSVHVQVSALHFTFEAEKCDLCRHEESLTFLSYAWFPRNTVVYLEMVLIFQVVQK